MERNQFTFYRSYYESLKHLPKRDRAEVLMAVIAYALDEVEPSLSGVPLSVFTLIRPTLDSGRNKARNRQNKTKTKREQNGEEKEEEREVEREVEREGEREGESEIENECLYITPPPNGVGVIADPAAEAVADYLNRVNAMASPTSLDEIAGYANAMGSAVCKRAFDIALDSKKTSWNYIRAILRDKLSAGVKCLADWDAMDEQRAAQKGAGAKARQKSIAPGQDFQPSPDRLKKQADWLDEFLEAQKGQQGEVEV